jgi:hypothetical protein
MDEISASSSVMIVFFDDLIIPFSDSIVNLISPSVVTTDNILISFIVTVPVM